MEEVPDPTNKFRMIFVHYRPLVWFDLNSIPADATIVDGSISLWRGGGRPALTVGAYRLTRDWAEGSDVFSSNNCSSSNTAATWTRANANELWETEGGDFAAPEPEDSTALEAVSSAGWDFVDISDAVGSWYDGLSPNLGVLLSANSDVIEYASDDYGTEPFRQPRLHVTYYEAGSPLLAAPTTIDGADRIAQASNFGGKWLFVGYRRPIFGTRSAIRTPSSDFVIPSSTLAVFRVAAHEHVGSGSSQLQAGFGMTNGEAMGNCGQRDRLTYYFEFIEMSSSLPSNCRWLDVSGVDPPLFYSHSRLYTVARSPDDCAGVSQPARSWRVHVDEFNVFCIEWINRLPVGPIHAGGEIAHRTELKRGVMSACYGCDGGRLWQRDYNVRAAGPSWKTIRSAQNLRNSASRGWTIGTLPGSWMIRNDG